MRESELNFADAVAELVYCNPFGPARIDAERRALGDQYEELGSVWHFDADLADNQNLVRLDQRLYGFVHRWCERLKGAESPASERTLYRDVVLYYLYNRYQHRMYEVITADDSKGRCRAEFFPSFDGEVRALFHEAGFSASAQDDPVSRAASDRGAISTDSSLLFARFFQIRRAFHLIFRHIVGGSVAAAHLRSSAWESIFTHDLGRFFASPTDRMANITTLITGASGTGKELVARAIGMSRFIAFEPAKSRFAHDFQRVFYPLNLSALSPTLIESELFGHIRGSFTGAVVDRSGWLEDCPDCGTVFLDEVGEVEESVQVKLLRVLETRSFHRIGETRLRPFLGKVVAATNRDPAVEMSEGRMREDFYYRLCSDIVRAPSLVEQLEGSQDELRTLVLSVARRLVSADSADELTAQVTQVVRSDLGRDYPWPGNFRELEQCVRNVMIRGTYRPLRRRHSTQDALQDALLEGSLTADELLSRYCALIYEREGSYSAAAVRLGLDRRTVKAKILAEPTRLAEKP